MFFNGLIKRYHPLLNGTVAFTRFCERFFPKLTGAPSPNAPKFMSGAQWEKLVQDFGFTHKDLVVPKPQSPEQAQALSDLIKMVHDAVFDTPHRCFFFQLIAMKPGGYVSRHTDDRNFFSFTHRFNLVLAGNEGTFVSSYYIDPATGSEVEFKFREDTGRLYELNNRTPHSAVNGGSSTAVFAVLDFISCDFPKLEEADWATDAKRWPMVSQGFQEIIDVDALKLTDASKPKLSPHRDPHP